MVCQALRDHGVSAPIDVHLMVEPVDNLVPAFAKAGADRISFHPEASRHVHRTVHLIKDQGCQVGLAFNPASSLESLPYLLPDLDLIVLMSVNPGFGGQHFIPSTLDKIKAVRALCQAQQLKTRVQVDGGINEDTIGATAKAGADTFVAGSAIFKHADRKAAIAKLRAQLKSSSLDGH